MTAEGVLRWSSAEDLTLLEQRETAVRRARQRLGVPDDGAVLPALPFVRNAYGLGPRDWAARRRDLTAVLETARSCGAIGGRVTTVGSWVGWLPLQLAAAGAEAVVAVDRFASAEDGLGALSHHAAHVEARRRVLAVQMDLEQLRLVPRSDLVVVEYCFGYFRSPAATLGTLRRMLLAGGAGVVLGLTVWPSRAAHDRAVGSWVERSGADGAATEEAFPHRLVGVTRDDLPQLRRGGLVVHGGGVRDLLRRLRGKPTSHLATFAAHASANGEPS